MTPQIQLGLRANASQFALLVALNALVGAMVGLERSVLPLVGKDDFGLRSSTAILAFVVAFGAAKAVTNLAAGDLAERIGRKRLLVVGWLVALPVPLPHRPRTVLVVHRRREPPARRQPGIRLVDDRCHEDRPGRAAAARTCPRSERGCRLPRRRRGGLRDGRPRDELRAAHSGLDRCRADRRRRAARERVRGAGHERACRARAGSLRRRHALARRALARLPARDRARTGPARMQPGRARQQPERRACVGARSAVSRRARRERARDRRRRRGVSALCGAPGNS